MLVRRSSGAVRPIGGYRLPWGVPPGFVDKEVRRKGGRGYWGVPQRGRLFNFDFPSATFWVKIFFGWVGFRAKRPPPPPFQTKPVFAQRAVVSGLLHVSNGCARHCLFWRPFASPTAFMGRRSVGSGPSGRPTVMPFYCVPFCSNSAMLWCCGRVRCCRVTGRRFCGVPWPRPNGRWRQAVVCC